MFSKRVGQKRQMSSQSRSKKSLRRFSRGVKRNIRRISKKTRRLNKKRGGGYESVREKLSNNQKKMFNRILEEKKAKGKVLSIAEQKTKKKGANDENQRELNMMKRIDRYNPKAEANASAEKYKTMVRDKMALAKKLGMEIDPSVYQMKKSLHSKRNSHRASNVSSKSKPKTQNELDTEYSKDKFTFQWA